MGMVKLVSLMRLARLMSFKMLSFVSLLNT